MEKKGVGRPRDGNPEETRREILRAAGASFAASGFVGATTRAVAARAGVNVATLHYHFGSKEGLYRAVLAEAARGALPVVAASSASEAVAGHVEALFAFGADRPTLARLAFLDALAGPGPGAAESPDARARWLADGLRPHLSTSDGRPAAGAEDAAKAIVAFVDAAFVAAGPPAAAPEGERAPALPDGAARRAVVAAALRLTGLG